MKTTIKLALSCILLISALEACKSKKEAAAAPPEAEKPLASDAATRMNCSTTGSYRMQVKGIIDRNCAGGCHSAAKQAGGIDLSTYESLKSEAGKPRFLGALKHSDLYSPMPKKSPKLSDSTINTIECWIINGMQN